MYDIELVREILREIQASFAASGMTEEELQEGGRKVREGIYRERYGQKAPPLC